MIFTYKIPNEEINIKDNLLNIQSKTIYGIIAFTYFQNKYAE